MIDHFVFSAILNLNRWDAENDDRQQNTRDHCRVLFSNVCNFLEILWTLKTNNTARFYGFFVLKSNLYIHVLCAINISYGLKSVSLVTNRATHSQRLKSDTQTEGISVNSFSFPKHAWWDSLNIPLIPRHFKVVQKKNNRKTNPS